MDYVIEVEISKSVDEDYRDRIKANLVDGTMRLASLPNKGTTLFLKDGKTAVSVEFSGLFQKYEFNADGLVVVGQLPIKKGASKIKAKEYEGLHA